MEGAMTDPDLDWETWENWDDVDKSDPIAVIRHALKSACFTIDGEYSTPGHRAIFEPGEAGLRALKDLEVKIQGCDQPKPMTDEERAEFRKILGEATRDALLNSNLVNPLLR
jgi:hypothetical protein